MHIKVKRGADANSYKKHLLEQLVSLKSLSLLSDPKILRNFRNERNKEILSLYCVRSCLSLRENHFDSDPVYPIGI